MDKGLHVTSVLMSRRLHFHALVDIVTAISDQPYHSRYHLFERVVFTVQLLVRDVAHHNGAITSNAEIGVRNVQRRLHPPTIRHYVSIAVPRSHAEVPAIGRQFAATLPVVHGILNGTPTPEEPSPRLLAHPS